MPSEVLKKAEELKLTGDHEKAIKFLEDVLVADLNVSKAYEEIADNFLSLKEFDKAILALEQAIKSNLGEATTKILSTLTPREERVLRMRFGVGMNTDHTLEEVGLQFSVTRERIRQIEAKALRKLKHPSRSKQLKSFLES